MDVYNKFIIATEPELGDYMVVSKCTFHKQLAADGNPVKGGGWYTIDNQKKTITFSGESHDFGRAEVSDIIECILADRVYRDKYQFKHLPGWTFFYDFESYLLQLPNERHVQESTPNEPLVNLNREVMPRIPGCMEPFSLRDGTVITTYQYGPTWHCMATGPIIDVKPLITD